MPDGMIKEDAVKQALVFLRCGSLPMMGLLVATLVAAGCSKTSSSNPTAVTIDELKYPGNLKIMDTGGGKISLQWFAANNESDFYGFNVYGMKTTKSSTSGGLVTHSDLTVTEGVEIQLLDDKNKPSDAAKAVLALFDFDPTNATPLEQAGSAPAPATPPTTTASSGNAAVPEFNGRPIVGLDSSGKGIYPTCQVGTGGVCTLTTSAGAGNTNVANGPITFDVSSATTSTSSTILNVGSTYCFFVLSAMKNAEKVSAVSSDVECVTPSYAGTFSYTLPSNSPNSQKFDLLGWQKVCTQTNCPDPTASTTSYFTNDTGTGSPSGAHASTDLGPVFFESIGAKSPSLVAGANNGILDLGYYANGFNDPLLPAKAPAITLDASTAKYNDGGYSFAGQSVPILGYHMYVVAVQDSTASTKYYYDWIYVNTASPKAGQSISINARLPKASM